MSLTIGTMELLGSKPTGLSPLPEFRRRIGFGLYEMTGDCPPASAAHLGDATRVLPYRVQDRYETAHETVSIKTVTLENEYLKAVFMPEFGGKLWQLFDKVNNRDLLMTNPVLQPRNLAIRNAWTSGGIEWNFGCKGHTYFTCDNVWTAAMKDENGEDFLRIYEFERAKECVWQADFHLPTGSRQLYAHMRVENPGDTDSTTYWWSNTAVPEDGGTRVLSCTDKVIVVCDGGVSYEALPYLSVMPGDLSYPSKATRAFDYFFQPEATSLDSWEGGVNREGYTFYDRSTAPLLYHKMFCWGNHRGGQHWQDYLATPGKGNYIELQAGFAPSQLHDKPFPAHAHYEWTQCFGGTWLEPGKIHGVPLLDADNELYNALEVLVPQSELLKEHERLCRCATQTVTEAMLLHRASGWGALEKERGKQLPEWLCFPADSMGIEQQPWLQLLREGVFPETEVTHIPDAWMVSEDWMYLLMASKQQSWLTALHIGNMFYEHWDNEHTAPIAALWPDAKLWEEKAEAAWLASIHLKKNVWALRNLGFLYALRGDTVNAVSYYDEMLTAPAVFEDFAYAAEYVAYLAKQEMYEKCLAVYESLPDHLRENGRILLAAAPAAAAQGRDDILDKVFAREYPDIREGEQSLTNLWFDVCARRMAEERGIAKPTAQQLQSLRDEAWDTCPPPELIDFRMSFDRQKGYRVKD